ncbi:MAG: hypothetical protein HQL78_13805 [Magnetococcales bacterium]|nr:hypothetical protein [Magnetococcales bacterium]
MLLHLGEIQLLRYPGFQRSKVQTKPFPPQVEQVSQQQPSLQQIFGGLWNRSQLPRQSGQAFLVIKATFEGKVGISSKSMIPSETF